MSDKKIFIAAVEISFDMPIVASSPEEAYAIARSYARDELENGQATTAVDLSRLSSSNDPGRLMQIPWGICDQDPRRDWPISKWLEEAEEPGVSDE